MSRTASIVLLGCLASSVAAACSCNAPDAPCAALRQGVAVFVGVVKRASPSLAEMLAHREKPINPYRIFLFAVEEDLSDFGQREVAVQTSTYATACGYPFQVGARYLVYASRTNGAAAWTTSTCSRTATVGDPKTAVEIDHLRGMRMSGRNGVVWGMVGEEAGGKFDGPAADEVVELAGRGAIASRRTGIRGGYEFRDLPPGQYTVRSQRHPEVTREVTLGAGGCAEVNFLVPRRE